MKRSCKHTDITNPKVVYPWVRDCVNKHADRYDFKRMMRQIGGLPRDYPKRTPEEQTMLWCDATWKIAEYAATCIKNRKLDLAPVSIRLKQDASSLKWRLIGRESAQQQVFDAIAVRAADEIWARRIVPQQCSSIKDRGQVYGTAMISRWVSKDYRAERYAKAHGLKYHRKCKWFAKLDVKRCFQSMRREAFMALFRRDCANKDLIWLWDELLKSHRVIIPETGEIYEGFMIGALPSQQAAQYILSFIYQFAMGLHKKRRDKQTKLLSHMMLFMDDMLLFSPSRRDLKSAARKVVRYAKEMFGITVNPTWQICNIEETPVDMMGYLIHADGNVTTRPRVFIRARRMALRIMRHRVSLRQARRISSYKGSLIQKKLPTRTRKIEKKLKLNYVFKLAAHVIGKAERRANDGSLHRKARVNDVYAAA